MRAARSMRTINPLNHDTDVHADRVALAGLATVRVRGTKYVLVEPSRPRSSPYCHSVRPGRYGSHRRPPSVIWGSEIGACCWEPQAGRA